MPTVVREPDVPLSAFLVLLQQRRRTCALRVGDDGRPQGALHVERGVPVHARFGELYGDAALEAMLGCDGLPYAPCEQTPHLMPNIARSLSALSSAAKQASKHPLQDDAVGAQSSIVPPPVSQAPTFVFGRRSLLALSALVLLGFAVFALRTRPPAHAYRPASVGTRSAAARSSSETPPAQPATASSPANATRHLVIKGSDTIGAALLPAWARTLEAERPELRVHVEALGSSTGFAGLIDGSAQIAASSRPARREEWELAAKLGVTFHEVTIGHDAIALIVHPDNALSTADLPTLARLFTGVITRWDQLGGRAQPVHLMGRPSYSGTHAFFRERVLTPWRAEAAFALSIRAIESSQDVVNAVRSDRNALGYVSFGYAQRDVRVLAVFPAAQGTALTPTVGTVRDGSYPIARSLYLYVRDDAGEDARALVTLALSDSGQAVVLEHGFVPLAESERRAPLATLGEGKRHALVRFYFAPGSAALDPAFEATLLSTAQRITEGTRAVIVGNADPGGSPEVIARTAQQRADAVATRLREYGVPAARMRTEVAGAERPLASNATRDGRRENRRVDVLIVPSP